MTGRRPEGAASLDLIPVMNLFTILVPFLLMSAQFVGLAVIDSVVPTQSPPEEELTTGEGGPPLLLRVGASGFVLAAGGEGLDERTVPCRPDCGSVSGYDGAALTRLLAQVKDERPTLESLVLVPEAWVPYEVIVLAMDAAREDRRVLDAQGRGRALFPAVVLASGDD